MSVDPLRDVSALITTGFFGSFTISVSPTSADALEQLCDSVGRKVMAYHAKRPFTAYEWKEIDSVGWRALAGKTFHPAPWEHAMARLTLEVARAAQNAIPIPGQKVFQPITVRLQDGTEVVLSARALKTRFISSAVKPAPLGAGCKALRT